MAQRVTCLPSASCSSAPSLLAVCFGFRFVHFFSLSAKQTACCSVVLLGVVAVVLLLLLSARCDGHFRSTHTRTKAYSAHTHTHILTGRSTVSFVNEFPFRFALALRFHFNSTCCTCDVPLPLCLSLSGTALSHTLSVCTCARSLRSFSLSLVLVCLARFFSLFRIRSGRSAIASFRFSLASQIQQSDRYTETHSKRIQNNKNSFQFRFLFSCFPLH